MERYISLNPASNVDIFKKDVTGINQSFKEKIAPYGLNIGKKDVILGDSYISVVTLISYPSVVNVG